MVKEYYLAVIRRAKNDLLAWYDLHDVRGWAKLVIPPLIVLVIKWIIGGFDALLQEILNSALIYVLGTSGWVVVSLLVMLFLAPARIDQEKQSSIKQLQKDKKELEVTINELINPKIDVRLSEFRPNVMMVGVKIENNGKSAIERCKVDLTDIDPDVEGMGNLPSELHWSDNNQPDENGFLTIPRGQEKSLDIASASDFYAAGEFKLRRGRSPIKFQPGTYSIKLSISGKSNSVDVPAQIYSAKIILEEDKDIRIEDVQLVGTK